MHGELMSVPHMPVTGLAGLPPRSPLAVAAASPQQAAPGLHRSAAATAEARLDHLFRDLPGHGRDHPLRQLVAGYRQAQAHGA